MFSEVILIFQIMTPDSERRNSSAMYNPMLVSELKAMFSWFDWALYFDTTFGVNNLALGDEETVIVVQPDFLLAAETLDRTPETVGM